VQRQDKKANEKDGIIDPNSIFDNTLDIPEYFIHRL
jgi:hypothetical protein